MFLSHRTGQPQGFRIEESRTQRVILQILCETLLIGKVLHETRTQVVPESVECSNDWTAHQDERGSWKNKELMKQNAEGLTSLYPRLKSASPGQNDVLLVLRVWFVATLVLNAISAERWFPLHFAETVSLYEEHEV